MNAPRDWEKIVRRMEQLLRLKSFPVAFKMLENKEDLRYHSLHPPPGQESHPLPVDYPGPEL